MIRKVENGLAKILPLLAVALGYVLCLYVVGGGLAAEVYGYIIASGLYISLLIFVCARKILKKFKELEQKLDQRAK